MNIQLWPEDFELNMVVQQGLKSFGFNQGRYMIDRERGNESEHAVHYFHIKVYLITRKPQPSLKGGLA
ncbi:MAG: hypothetical protein ACI845_002774 [Gammaproteobacteria bacterium]|jgi:choline monooxygenase